MTALTGLAADPEGLRAVLDSIGAGVYAVDAHGAITWVNREAEHLLGRLAGDLVGRPAHALLHARRRDGSPYPEEQCPLLRVAQEGGRAEEEDDVFVRGDGTMAPVSWTSSAVLQDGQVRGAVVVFRSTVREHQLRELREQARAAEQAEQARLRAALDRLALLGDASALLAGARDLSRDLSRLARLLVPRLADAVAVDLLEEDGRLHRVAQVGDVPAVGEPPAVVRVLDLDGRCALVLPLVSRGSALGAMVLVREDGPPPHEERELAEDLAGRTALALQNDRLLRGQRAISETLQRSLLTMLPHVDHIRIAARYLPAGRHSEVGGDWYDSFLLPDGCTALVIGDIAGHDVDSAARMGQVRNILRGIAVDRGAAPAELLTRLDLAVDRLGAAGLATVVFARVELLPGGDRLLRWSNAGHPPPLLVHADGRVEALDTPPDLPLGVLPGEPREDHELALPPGCTVLFYTDGLVETRADSVDVGLVRLRQAAGRHARDDAETFCDGVLADLEDAHDSPDDIAVLALRVPLPEDDGPPPDTRAERRQAAADAGQPVSSASSAEPEVPRGSAEDGLHTENGREPTP